MLHYIQIFTNTYEVMMQVKHAIGKAILYKLPIYYEDVLCWISPWFGMICLFSKCNKSSTTRLRSLNITFHLCCKCATFLCARTPCNGMKRSINICFYRGREHLWIVFGFKQPLHIIKIIFPEFKKYVIDLLWYY